MKSSFLIFLCALAIISNSRAQSNTFPASGNVGIGTTTPQSKLDVQGQVSIGLVTPLAQLSVKGSIEIRQDDADSKLTFHDPGSMWYTMGIDYSDERKFKLSYGGEVGETSGITLTNTGFLGVGTTTPASLLHLHQPNNGNAELRVGTWGNNVLARTWWYTGTFSYGAGIDSDNKFKIWKNINDAAPLMTFTQNDYVGIGTTNPTAKLTVTSGNDDARIKLYSNGGSVAVIDAVANTNDATGRWLSINPTGGNVAIGTVNPSHKLTVNGAIRAKEVIVDTGWADYVFASDYRLAPLGEVEQHIKENKRLPGIPSADEIAEKGANMGELQVKMMAKIEELTLHLIDQGKQLQTQRDEIRQLRTELKQALQK